MDTLFDLGEPIGSYGRRSNPIEPCDPHVDHPAERRRLSGKAAEVLALLRTGGAEYMAQMFVAVSFGAPAIVVLQRRADLRLSGQEATLTVEWQPGASDAALTVNNVAPAITSLVASPNVAPAQLPSIVEPVTVSAPLGPSMFGYT